MSFTTATVGERLPKSPVRITMGGRTRYVPEVVVTSSVNADDGATMKAPRVGATEPSFRLETRLVATTDPKPDEVVPYRGVVMPNGGESAVSCSVFRRGAGVLKPYRSASVGLNPRIACHGQDPARPVASFTVARNPSPRLAGYPIEARSAADTETLPSFLSARIRFDKAAIEEVWDDGSPEGDRTATLQAPGLRVPTNQSAADPAIYGRGRAQASVSTPVGS